MLMDLSGKKNKSVIDKWKNDRISVIFSELETDICSTFPNENLITIVDSNK